MSETIDVIDLDTETGHMHKIKIPRNNPKGKVFEKGKIYTHKDTENISKDRSWWEAESTPLFKPSKILEEF